MKKITILGGKTVAWFRRKGNEIGAVFGVKKNPEFSFYIYHALVRRIGVDAAGVIMNDSFAIRFKEDDPKKVREITMQYQQPQIVMENIKPLGEC